MRQLVLDAGPLIGFFYTKDTYHQQCVDGFRQLAKIGTRQIVPLPIVFEVYKWLLQRTYTSQAHHALKTMEDSFYLLPLESDTFGQLQDMVTSLAEWQGSLEDATVVLTALQYRCPVWTYNYRDFAISETLKFWNPESNAQTRR